MLGTWLARTTMAQRAAIAKRRAGASDLRQAGVGRLTIGCEVLQ
ncbi:hypothetical protein [Streptomyces sp. CA2R101]